MTVILPPGWRLLCYDTIGSTNDEACLLARDGAAEGTLVWAREQTAGRGRRGRPWASPRGNLYASLILRPACPPARAAQLGFVAAVALGGALAPLLPPSRAFAYKWPNDVLLDGRKLAGILLEAETLGGGEAAFVVVGAGVNLACAPEDSEFPAISLGPMPPEPVLAAYAEQFRIWLSRWRSEGFAPVRAAWLARAAFLGEPIRVRLDSAAFDGRFLDIDEEGTLLLEEAGCRRHISVGEVFPAQG
jgi:BirA family biotin operon repressor/biotin-[acetyl-CoA-carboxylase] ligase